MSSKMPIILKTRDQLREWRDALRAKSASVGFVPTMGALHAGHAELLRQARIRHDSVLLSIFVNPAQFGRGEDYSAYPRTFQDDLLVASAEHVDAVFVPSAQEMYPDGFGGKVTVASELTNCFEGAARPGHFDGVCLVVSILLHLSDPDVLYLGQKDYQQCVVIRAMIRDLGMRVRSEIIPTVRDRDGLALSSRNRYLTELARAGARLFPGAMNEVGQNFLAGERRIERLLSSFESYFQENNPDRIRFELDYVAAHEIWGLKPVHSGQVDELVIAAVLKVHLGPPGQTRTVRLLDNIVLSLNEPWKRSLEDLCSRVQAEPLNNLKSLFLGANRNEGDEL